MEIFDIAKDKLGFGDSKRFTTVMIVCSIVLPLSLMVLLTYLNSSMDPTDGFTKATILDEKAENVKGATLGLDSKGDSSPPNGTRGGKLFDELLPPRFSNETGSKNDLSQPARMPDDKVLLNGTLAPEFERESLPRNHSSQSTSSPDDKPLNETIASGFGKISGPGNVSSDQRTRMANDEKLLDGLLPPSFDERSCLSRYQSFLFRKASPHKPSPFLLSKLRSYENLHKFCGPYTKSFRRSVKSLKSGHGSSRTGCNYLIWIPVNGLGNRMVSLASTFLYALLTDRVLLVELGTDMAGLFCEPFPDSSWILPKDFPHLKEFHSRDMRHAHGFGTMLKNGIINMSMESPPSYLFVNTDHGRDDRGNQYFYCNQNPSLFKKVPWLFFISDQYFAPSFFLTPAFKQDMQKLFPEKETVFHHVGRYLFHPSDQVWGLITRFYQAYLAKADERIGLQIRIYNTKTTSVQVVLDQILGCSLKEKFLPRIDTQKSVATASNNQRSKAILVASLHPEFYENISNMYWTKPTMTGEVVGVYQSSHEEFQHFGDIRHNIKAWADIYLLSLSDVLVTSSRSTFGYVAQGLGGLKPWVLYMVNHRIPNPPCIRDLSMDPCFHFPLTFDCKTESKIDAGALLPFLRHCEDWKMGVKLVNDA